jgi:hypothetical protein
MTGTALAARWTAAVATALAALTVVPMAGADQPTRFTEEVDQTFFAPGTSAVCGFPVFVTQQGTANVLLWRASDGTTVIRELDWNSNFRVTFTAPTQGTSFSYKGGGTLKTLYPEGAAIGAPATAILTGFGNHIDGDPAEAGRVVMSAVVVFIGPGGIPGIDFLGTLSSSGHFLGDTFQRRCEALAAP